MSARTDAPRVLRRRGQLLTLDGLAAEKLCRRDLWPPEIGRRLAAKSQAHLTTRFWNDPVGVITRDSARKPTIAEAPVEAVGHSPFGGLLRKDLHSLKP